MTTKLKNYAPSCDRNQSHILSALEQYLKAAQSVLEIGSYSGQHALYFTRQISSIVWQPTDTQQYVEDLRENLSSYVSENLLTPKLLDVDDESSWPSNRYDLLFTANTLHIMSWTSVTRCFLLAGEVLHLGGKLAIYGPFNYQGKYTSPSNADFDIWLKERDAKSGIRDIEAIEQQASLNGLQLLDDRAMPANNRLLIFKKHS